MGRGWGGWGEVEGTGGRLTYIKEHFSLYISFYLKYPHSSVASCEQYLKKIYYDSCRPDKLYGFIRKDEKFVLSKYKIKKILKTKGKGNNKQYFVKWLHWPKKFNSWISARDVNNLWSYYQWVWTIPGRLTLSLCSLLPCTKDSILLALSCG